jgi:hypothetical protein
MWQKLVALDKNSFIGQVEKTHFSFSVTWLRKLIGETWLNAFLFRKVDFIFLEWIFLLEEVLYITNLTSHNLVMKIMQNPFIHNSYISHIDIMHWKHIFHIDL